MLTQEEILRALKRYDSMSPGNLRTVFGMQMEEAENLLGELKQQGLVEVRLVDGCGWIAYLTPSGDEAAQRAAMVKPDSE